MEKSKRLPSKEGLREAQEILKRLRKKHPTEELIRIVGEEPEVGEGKDSDSKDRAAKAPGRDLDF